MVPRRRRARKTPELGYFPAMAAGRHPCDSGPANVAYLVVATTACRANPETARQAPLPPRHPRDGAAGTPSTIRTGLPPRPIELAGHRLAADPAATATAG